MANLEFDFDDLLTSEFDAPPLLSSNKRKKIIGLDDLFKDHKKEQEKNKKGKLKVVKGSNVSESDDDDDANNETENKLTEALHGFQKTICEVDGHDGGLNDNVREDVNSGWGLQVFGTQKTPSFLAVPHLEGCMLFQTSLNDEINVLLNHNSDMGETLLEGLLLNGWLLKLIITCGFLEESIAKWTLNLLFYSSEESLMASACEFWSAILCHKVDAHVNRVEWIPSLVELKGALESFGFQLHSSADTLNPIESTMDGSDCKGPPPNIRAWIKFADVCCQARIANVYTKARINGSTFLAVLRARSRYIVFSTQEAEELIGILICLFLERKLLGLTGALHDCLLSAINFFEEEEWSSSCEKVAILIVHRIPLDLNCLRVVGCISGVDSRSKQLRSVVAYQYLTTCYAELTDAKDILKYLMSKSLKDKSCNLFKTYLCLVLMENWLLFGPGTDPVVNELWTGFVRKCSIQISNTDFRPCAQEIRNRASYLLHSTIRD